MNKRIFLLGFLLFSILISPSLSAQIPIKLSAGASLGGTGLAGVPIQVRIADIVAIDIGGYFRTAHVDEYEDRWFFGPSADAGINFFLFKRGNQDKNKTTEHGIYLKAGYGLNKNADYDMHLLKERTVSLGWLMEINKSNNPGRFFQIEFGPSIKKHSETFYNTRYPQGFQIQYSERLMPMIYCRLGWFFVVGR